MDTFKLYLESEEEAMAYSAAEAEFRGCNMESTIFWWAVEEDENGYYLVITDIQKPSV